MAVYVYRCRMCGDFEVARPMGGAPAGHPCPRCASAAVRRWTAPRVGRGTTAGTRLAELAEKSAHEPAVGPAPPPRPVLRAVDPRHARLPRP